MISRGIFIFLFLFHSFFQKRKQKDVGKQKTPPKENTRREESFLFLISIVRTCFGTIHTAFFVQKRKVNFKIPKMEKYFSKTS